MNSKLLYILRMSVLAQVLWYYFLCGMCSRLDEQEALFARVHKSTERERERERMNWMYTKKMQLHMLFGEANSHTHTHTRTQMFFDIWYSIFDMCGMINYVRDVIWICKDRINT